VFRSRAVWWAYAAVMGADWAFCVLSMFVLRRVKDLPKARAWQSLSSAGHGSPWRLDRSHDRFVLRRVKDLPKARLAVASMTATPNPNPKP